jgi:uncharacterized membrane protein
MATSSQEGSMPATQGSVQDLENARVALVLIAVAIVAFWRIVLRVLLAVIVIALVVTVSAGAIVLLGSTHH